MIERTETLTSDDGPMGVYVVAPDGDGPFPVVVSFHHGPGLDAGAKEAMARIAGWGYEVVSHDRYHRHEPWFVLDRTKPVDDATQARFWEVLNDTTEEQVAADLDAVLAYLADEATARPAPMGCIGYCIGARSVLRTIGDRGDRFRAGVALHPSFCTTDEPDSPHLVVPGYTGSLYVAFGTEDKMQPAAANTAFIDATNALDRGEAEVLDGANHGFAVPGPAYHEPAAERAYERARAAFDRELTG